MGPQLDSAVGAAERSCGSGFLQPVWGVAAALLCIPASLIAENVKQTLSKIDKSFPHLRRVALLAPAAGLGALVRHPNHPTAGVVDLALTDRTGRSGFGQSSAESDCLLFILLNFRAVTMP
jgi:hypothetical protein